MGEFKYKQCSKKAMAHGATLADPGTTTQTLYTWACISLGGYGPVGEKETEADSHNTGPLPSCLPASQTVPTRCRGMLGSCLQGYSGSPLL